MKRQIPNFAAEKTTVIKIYYEHSKKTDFCLGRNIIDR